MKFVVLGKNIEVTDALREKAEAKVGKLKKFFHAGTEAHVTMSVIKGKHIVEVTIPFHGMTLRAQETNGDMYTSIDKVIDSLERQIVRHKSKLTKKVHESAFRNNAFIDTEDYEPEHDYKIVKSKKFPVKPMPLDEAIMQMELLGHEFFMFSNSNTNKVNVVYKRNDGNVGLIEPEF